MRICVERCALRACFCLMRNASRRSFSASSATRATSASSFARRLPVPSRLAGFVGELVDRADRRLHLLVAEHDRAEHDLLGQLLRLGLHHQHRVLGAGHDEVELRLLELRRGRVEDVLAVDVADARGADRAVERNAGERERGGDADHRRDVGIDLGVHRHHRRDDLDFVVEAVGEQRPDRAVDQARGQDVLLRRPPFALEEAAGNLAGGVVLLDVVDGERKEVLPGLRLLGRRRRCTARRCRPC